MGKIWRLLGYYDAETTTYSAVAGLAGDGASPFTPDFNGRLVGLRTIQSQGAATTLIEHAVFKLTCANWRPNVIHIGVQGPGLMTAPAQNSEHMDWAVDQPIQAGVPITIEAKNMTSATPVTVEALLYGCFEVS